MIVRIFLLLQVVAAFSLLKKNLRIDQLTGHRLIQKTFYLLPFLVSKMFSHQGLEARIEGFLEKAMENPCFEDQFLPFSSVFTLLPSTIICSLINACVDKTK